MNKKVVANPEPLFAQQDLPNRFFIGWDKPIISAACERLLQRASKSQKLDLSNTTLVFPVNRAKQTCALRLSELASFRNIEIEMPWFATIGELPDRLYVPAHELAGEMQQTLAWSHVLSRCDDEELRPLVPPGLSRESILPWTDLGSLLRRLIEDIAVDNIWPEDVAERITDTGPKQRWSLIARLRQRYLNELQSVGLTDPLESRRIALREGRCQSRRRFVFIGCVDLGKLLTAMVSQASANCEVWIGAPESHSEHFDDWGRVIPHQWLASFIEVDDQTITSADSAQDQTSAAAAIVQSWESSTETSNSNAESSSTEERNTATIGITDDSFAPLVETDLELTGHHPHWTAGIPIPQTAPGTLITRVGEFILGQSWSTFAALVRHSDVLSAFAPRRSYKVLQALDQLRAEHFPHRIDEPLPEKYTRLPEAVLILDLRTAILQWLSPLMVPNLSLAQCAHALREVLATVYAEADGSEESVEPLDPHRQQSLEIIRRMLDAVSTIPAQLDVSVSSYLAVQMLHNRMAHQHVIPAKENTATTIAGWLEIVFDDAPSTVIVGMNHPFVPQAISGDPFLPTPLRSLLGIADNDRRFARDAFILQNIVHSRSRIAIIVGRRGPDESPTPPSRLLASCPAQQVLKRTLRLLDAPADAPTPITRWDTANEKRNLPIPSATSDARLTSISVTAFRDYLTCPFRFYLRHILKMRPRDDKGSELAANQFGDLVHAAVEDFGKSDAKASTDPSLIAESLIDHLYSYARNLYGSKPTAPIRIQIAQAAKRLYHVAKHQSDRAREGWLIHSVEDAVTESHGAAITVDDHRRLLLKGRVDRIDYHPEKKQWAILDYKTHGHKPFDKHYDSKKECWIDLQLPLYLFMLEALNIHAEPEQVSLGYFNIAEKELDSGVHLAEFTPDLLASAHTEARRVAASILEKDFTPQLDATKVPYDDYAMIMQTGIRIEATTDDLELSDS